MHPWLRSSLALILGACRPGAPSESVSGAGTCPDAWLDAPAVDPSIAVPSGNSRMVLHAAAKGSQNYACTPVAVDGAMTYTWSLLGPEAVLTDCHSEALGHHFASDAGLPEWQWVDGAYVVARKVAASTAGKDSVPWLLLRVDGQGRGAPFTDARYVQRVHTSGGLAPVGGCDASHAGALRKVAYSADYFFYGL
jgi:uncharacterized protein DUF3455